MEAEVKATAEVEAEPGFSKEDFKSWYGDSALWEEMMKEADHHVDEKHLLILCPPAAASPATALRFFILLPMLICFKLTLPDVRVDGKEYWYPVTIVGTLGWIWLATSRMAMWATAVAHIIGLPPHLIGLTLIASALATPTTLTALIVAQQGKGVAAISNALGKPIATLLGALPLSCLVFSLTHAKPAFLGESDSLFGTLVLLIGLLALTVSTLACHDWRATRCLGACLLLLYALLLTQDVGRALGYLSLPYL